MKSNKAFLFTEFCFILGIICIFTFEVFKPLNLLLWFCFFGIGSIVYIIDWGSSQ